MLDGGGVDVKVFLVHSLRLRRRTGDAVTTQCIYLLRIGRSKKRRHRSNETLFVFLPALRSQLNLGFVFCYFVFILPLSPPTPHTQFTTYITFVQSTIKTELLFIYYYNEGKIKNNELGDTPPFRSLLHVITSKYQLLQLLLYTRLIHTINYYSSFHTITVRSN